MEFLINLKDKLKKIRRYFLWRLFLANNNFRKDTWYFILSYGIGDTYMVCALMEEFTRLNGNAELLFTKENHVFIAKIFNINTKTRVLENYPRYIVNEFTKFKKGRPITLHPMDLYDEKLLALIGFKNFTLIDTYKSLLGLVSFHKIAKPSFTDIDSSIIIQYFIDYKLTLKKTVLLCPSANSITTISSLFWIALAKKIKQNGYTPVFMNFSEANVEFVNIDFPLAHSIQFCNLANYVVSLRSGFCDLIATSSAKKIILYPDIDWYAGKLIDGASLLKMNLSETGTTLELIINEDQNNLHNQILIYINE